MAETDSDGRGDCLRQGSWTADSAPGSRFQSKEDRACTLKLPTRMYLVCPLSIQSQDSQQQGGIVLPFTTADYVFDSFGTEPTGWTFTPTIDSDAAIVTWKLFSTWIPGDPPNG